MFLPKIFLLKYTRSNVNIENSGSHLSCLISDFQRGSTETLSGLWERNRVSELKTPSQKPLS